ncbi:MAG: (2Fe-2S) ferredoxin domain-containing protein [Ruminococcus sp.]|nr:(2Fe-2S) ferredoxin domain-containing protein [Ruminococcus sp.]
MKTLEELKAIKDKMRDTIALRHEDPNATKVIVAMATCGIASGARGVLNAFAEAVAENGLIGEVTVSQSGCIGLCKYEPVAQVVTPDGNKVTYINLTPQKAKEIVEKHLVGGNIVDEYKL